MSTYTRNTSGSNRSCIHPNRTARQEGAKSRQEEYDKLSDEQKVAQAGAKQLSKFVKKGGNIAALAQARIDG